MVCTPGSFCDARSRISYPSIPGICTSTSTSRHWPHFTSRSASSGSDVGTASYPISAITADSTSSCAGSSSRMHGVNEDFGAAISTVFGESNPTMPTLVATHVPLPHPLHLAALGIFQGSLRIHHPIETIAVTTLWRTKIRFRRRIDSQIDAALDSNCFATRASRSTSVQKWFPPSHFGTPLPQLSKKRTLSPPDSHASFQRRLLSSCPELSNYFALSFEEQFGWICLSRNCCCPSGVTPIG